MNALKKILLVVVAAYLLFLVVGCGIIQGAGKDLKVFGTVVDKTFEPWEQHRKQAELDEAAKLVFENRRDVKRSD